MRPCESVVNRSFDLSLETGDLLTDGDDDLGASASAEPTLLDDELLDDGSEVQVGKVLSTPEDPSVGLLRGLEEIAREDDMILDLPAPRVRMRAFGPSSIDFQLMGWIKYPEQRGLATHRILLAIDRRFREEGITIPFPQQDVHIKSVERLAENPRED